MGDDDPTNGELAQMILAMDRRVKDREDDEARFHLRMEAKMDTLSATVVIIQTNAAVADARVNARFDAVDARQDMHDQYTQDREKESRVRTGTVIAGLATAGTLAAVAVAIAIAVH